jgi:hypothetical protein
VTEQHPEQGGAGSRPEEQLLADASVIVPDGIGSRMVGGLHVALALPPQKQGEEQFHCFRLSFREDTATEGLVVSLGLRLGAPRPPSSFYPASRRTLWYQTVCALRKFDLPESSVAQAPPQSTATTMGRGRGKGGHGKVRPSIATLPCAVNYV